MPTILFPILYYTTTKFWHLKYSTEMKHVAVLMGGWSSERAVSLRSGEASATAAEECGYKVSRVDVGKDVATVLAKLKPNVALNMLHGPFGEDGCIQGLLEILQIPYSHSGVLSSALAMNKWRTRTMLINAGVPVAKGFVLSRLQAGKKHAMNIPYVIKPISEGSSVGVIIVKDKKLPRALLSKSWKYGNEVLIEKFIPGRELTCAVMGNKALGVLEIRFKSQIYDYEAKYAPGGSEHILPAKLPSRVYKKIQQHALAAHKALGCRGVSRVDFRYDDKTDTLVCLEVNTQPGMTNTSLVPEIAAYAGISFKELVRWMIEDASLQR